MSVYRANRGKLWIGRSPFPLAVLKHCTTGDQTDDRTIERSHHLGTEFHGVVELKDMDREGHKIMQAADWKLYTPKRNLGPCRRDGSQSKPETT